MTKEQAPLKTSEEYFWEYKLNYRGYTIQHKRDFGDGWHLIDGMPVRAGFVVVDQNGCLALPGACWDQTVAAAKESIDVLLAVGGDAKAFWHVTRKIQTAKEAAKTRIITGHLTKVLGVRFREESEWSDC